MEKIKKIFLVLKQDLLLARHFGIKIAFIDFIRSFILRGKSEFGKKLEFYKYENIKKWLSKKYGYIIEEYKNNEFSQLECSIKEDAPIWIFWWQGIEAAPKVVKMCIERIKKYSGTHPVIILTKHNYSKYVDLPEYIIEKVNKKYFTITLFSDVLRVALLYKHGGIWMDATLYLTNNISDELCKYSFYTIRHETNSDYHVCKGLWTGFFLAANKGNIAFKYFRDIFFEYLKNENMLICYLLIDCIIALGYENIPIIHQMIEDVPKNNIKVFDLQTILDKEYSSEIYEDMLRKSKIYKLTYRIKFPSIRKGKLTFYGYLMNNSNQMLDDYNRNFKYN
ncbi:capsular polysaccharide synthesis protein [Clostridium saccharoperbutylacetonicum]|uniref:capsular polysaccharide synthesis protein n=1 Tax=Clostridium saccharoperbutylacetonicum TaxID=36745 RepID=UPI000983AE58|nr:capsular polysaccharide synthesis protein [Clostridium saccharoperbutylacetonicum]AQR95087.1 capsular polysaccharide synthesis protein [Clostridium saccharoperbutylacetonicum]NSB30934.1 hypothetical protein [Clostridium saccharoperbutylacetonicum]